MGWCRGGCQESGGCGGLESDFSDLGEEVGGLEADLSDLEEEAGLGADLEGWCWADSEDEGFDDSEEGNLSCCPTGFHSSPSPCCLSLCLCSR